MKINNTVKLIISLIIPQLAGGLGSYFTIGSVKDWYPALVKPALNPPLWVFGPVWTTLFALMGIAVWLVWKHWDQGNPSTRLRVKIALAIFGLQLFLNTLWSIIFFNLRSPGGALVKIVLLWLAILATIIAFAKISKPAAWLMLPYILWVTFAGYLNFGIWRLNKKSIDTANISLPQGYTLDSYSIVNVTQAACTHSTECTTPMEYMVRSNCPYTSVCINKKCAVICPKYK